MQSLIIPLIKNKTGDLSDGNNYRAIALTTSMSKIFECILLQFVVSKDTIDACQFGFKSIHSPLPKSLDLELQALIFGDLLDFILLDPAVTGDCHVH